MSDEAATNPSTSSGQATRQSRTNRPSCQRSRGIPARRYKSAQKLWEDEWNHPAFAGSRRQIVFGYFYFKFKKRFSTRSLCSLARTIILFFERSEAQSRSYHHGKRKQSRHHPSFNLALNEQGRARIISASRPRRWAGH